MPLIAITRLRIRSWRFLPAFFYYALRSSLQAKKAQGNLAVATLRDVGYVFWTRTAWNSEAEMKTYMLAGPHRKAMRKLLEWCDEAALAHWNQDTLELPSWEDAYQKLIQVGRTSKVNHPTEDQKNFHVPPPQVRPNQEFRYK